MNKTKFLFCIILLFSFSKLLNAQMPDWTLLIDKDENHFYIDKNGKIWTAGKPELDYKPVTIEGLDYYLNQGIELIKSHYKAEGLLLLKSILAMPSKNDVIYNAQKNASKEINNLIKKEGSRFKELNENACILLFKDNNIINLINDNMLYYIKSPYSLKIISKRTREKINYVYYGILLGFRFKNEDDYRKKNNSYSNYDLLVAIDSEKFSSPIKEAGDIEEHWRKTVGSDTLERTILKKDKKQIIYSYRDRYFPNYSGIEGFYSKSNLGYCLKAITSAELFQKYKMEILEIVDNFKIL